LITGYIEVLQPLNSAIDCLQGYGNPGTNGTLFEVIPVSKSLVSDLAARHQPISRTNYEAAEAREYHPSINLRVKG
jgi:hypothetical protein